MGKIRVQVGLPLWSPSTKAKVRFPSWRFVWKAVLTQITPDYELVLVDDSSPDHSWDVVCRLAQQYSWIRAIRLMRNYGQHNAVLCGIRAAQYSVIITMDDDLQHPPEEIPKLLDTLDRGFDVVYGAPEHEQHGLGRDLAPSADQARSSKRHG